MKINIFDRLSFWSLFLVVVLMPIFCLPFTNIPLAISKGLLLVVGLVACVVFWSIARFYDGKIVLPKSWLLLSGFVIVLVFLLSALFSKSSQVSLFGTMLDAGSFWFIFSAFVLMLMCSVIFRTPKQAKMVLLGVISSSVLLLIFQIAHSFFPTFLSLGIFSDKTANIFGSWNSLGIFAGFSSFMLLLVLEFFQVSKIQKILLGIFILLSVLMAILVNFSLVWILLGISSLIIFVYKLSINFHARQDEEKKKIFPVISFIVTMLALIFLFSGSFISSFVSNRLQISNDEFVLNFPITMSITKGVLVAHPILGIGPNRFSDAWAMYKPISVNGTIYGNSFWNTSFSSGSGLLPTLTATTGILGILAWILFVILFLYMGANFVFTTIKNKVNLEMMTFFVLSLYFFVASFFYSVGAAIFLLALAFTGIFIGLATSTDSEVSISFFNDDKKRFFSFLALILMMIFSVGVLFKYAECFASISYFEKALSAQTEPLAENYIGKALSLYSNDLYLRTSAQIYIFKINSIANQTGIPSDADKANFESSLDQATKDAQLAVAYDPLNYMNQQIVGSVYQALGSLGDKNGYSDATLAYENASNLNPLNPGLKLNIADSMFLDGQVTQAETYAKQALSLKPDYSDALIFLSQLSLSQGDNTNALQYGQEALYLDPTNQDLNNYVNSLRAPQTVKISTPPATPKTKK